MSCINVDDVAYSTANWTNLDAGTSFNTNCSPAIVNIPDANFKNRLINSYAVDQNRDGEIQFSEAKSVQKIYCSNKNITDMTGIEAFYSLEELYCQSNNISNLDLSQNTSLSILNCVNNNLTNLDITNNTYMVLLYCSNNPLTDLDLTKHNFLKKLYAGMTQLTSLDLSQNRNLVALDCASAQLNNLSIKNGRNSSITTFNVTNNPNLSCIEVDDVIYSTNNWSTNIDATAFFSTNCHVPNQVVHIYDPNFKAYLVGNTAINTNGDTEIQVAEASAFTGTIDCSGLAILNLRGIKAFTSLTGLDCSSNHIYHLDLSQNTSLTALDCSSNRLRTLDLSQHTNLTALNCSTNRLVVTLDLSQNISLTALDCSHNYLSTLDLVQHTSLTALDCSTNPLRTLDLSQNVSLTALDCSSCNLNDDLDLSQHTSLTALNCSGNNLSNLNVKNGNNTNITVFEATNNSILGCISVDNVTYSTANWANIDATTSFSTSCIAQNVYIPNSNFKTILLSNPAINTNGDIEIQFSEAVAFTGMINCAIKNIDDLTGIEAFINLSKLKCYNNSLTSLDLSQNTSLTQIYCQNNQISSINLPQSATLMILYCFNNEITSLGLNQYTNLTKLNCSNNKITSMDLNQYTNLMELDCFENEITSLDASQNTTLTKLICSENEITSLDVSQNTNLATLICSNNQMTSLDLSQNTNLTKLICSNNQMTSLNVKNGNNTILTYFKALSNQNLSCIEVDNVAYSSVNWPSINGAITSFSTNCNIVTPRVVYIPDANFKAYLVGNTAINTNGDSEIQFSEAAAFNGKINCRSAAINSLVGIEEFTSLTELDCFDNNITSLDLTKNVALESLDYSNTGILSADLSQNVALKTLLCNNVVSYYDYAAQLHYLDLSQNINLESLSCNYNYLRVLDLTQNVNLKSLDCNNNKLTKLSLTQNINLTSLDCYDNKLTELSLTQNTNLTELKCENNELTELSLIQNTNLTKISCGNNELVNLDLSQNTNLVDLYCTYNYLSSLNIKNGNNTIISHLNAGNNPYLNCIEVDDINHATINWTRIDAVTSFSTNCGLVIAPIVNIPDANFKAYLLNNIAINTNRDSEIQLSEASAFTGEIRCYNKNIVDLIGIEAFVNLSSLDCSSNNIISLDLSQNTNLVNLFCYRNNLSSLNIKNGNNTNINDFYTLNNPPLICIEVDNPAYSAANWTNIDAATFFSTNCNALTVRIPDANFKAYLVGNTAINTNGDAEIQVTEATLFSGVINCPRLGIRDLTGIEAFVNVVELKCYNNSISSLDLSQNTSLRWLHCVNNSISSLDLSQNTSLRWLYCSNNPISSLDLSQNAGLKKLYCTGSQLSSLNIRNGNNTALTIFKVINNPNLTCITVDDIAYSTSNWTDVDAIASFNTACALVPSMLSDAKNSNSDANAAADFSLLNSLEVENSAMNLSVYPNPATKEITLDFGKTYEVVMVQIMNLSGQIIKQKSVKNSALAKLELDGSAGIYFVSVQTETERMTLKVIKE